MNEHRLIVLSTILQVALQITHAVVPSNRGQFERFVIASNEINNNCNRRPSITDYLEERKHLIDEEIGQSFGADIKLNENEQRANKIIQDAKEAEYQTSIQYPNLFNPSHHIFEILDKIKQSKLFQIIQKMPKGGILHAHDMALCSTDYVLSLTYWDNLWQCTSSSNTNEIITFKFSRHQPADIVDDGGNNNTTTTTTTMVWRLVKDVRDQIGKIKYDEYVRTLFTLYDKNVNPKIQFHDINDVWNRFLGIFGKVAPFITYAPVWKAYYKHALKEMLADGVQYLEFRGVLPQLYDLDGNKLSDEAEMEIYIEALNEFKQENPSFIGSKFIYAPNKIEVVKSSETYFERIRRLHEKFPAFLAGFDLVGQEDTAPTLFSFSSDILKLPSDIKLFFHAGETNWFGSVDENLVDAVLLGSKRIGHGYGLLKHPKLIEYVKANDIAVEVNPISNQVLKLIDDYRNHPASVFLAQNIPLVISSDDPSFWEATPLSHDFYMAFLGCASRHSDLRILKKFAINSIQYSSLNETEQQDAFAKWQVKWDSFIDNLINENQ